MTPREKFIIMVIGVFVALVALGAIINSSNDNDEPATADVSSLINLTKDNQENLNRIYLKNYCFEVELALTAEQQRQGLMYRQELDADKGMLFVFKQSQRHTFWMKNTYIPLDIIWINESYQVADISHQTQPCQANQSCPVIRPTQDALYVLEIKGGLAEQIGLKIGDEVNFQLQ